LVFARALGLCFRSSLALGIASLGLGCSAAPVKSPASGLPSYGAEDAALLDDGLSGHLFETAFVPGNAGDDPHFQNRVLRAEDIWLVKVATVSREGMLGDNRSYGLTFRPLESLAGPLPTEPISLTISARDPSFHWLDRVEGGWVGHEVLLMVRRYGDGDNVVLHFHGEPNTPVLRAQILEIRAQASEIRRAPRPQQ
jgi:hypothetical protein